MTSSLDLAYNTDLESLIIPEYGRNIHKMVEHAKKVQTKEERNKCAKAIVKVMDLINPNTRNNNNSEEHQQKLWSHLFIISNFELDVDSHTIKPRKILTKLDLKKYLTQVTTSSMDIMVK